jgi:alpha-beta hydrolase superfamily lysophospholipase
MPKLGKIALAALAVTALFASGAIGAALLGSRPSIGSCSEPAPAARESDGTRFTPYRVTAADGNCLQAYEWKPVGRPVRGVLVVVHGIHDHARRYETLARALNEQGVAVYAGDHRGHGPSGGARQRVDSVGQLAGDVDLSVREAAKRNPGVPLFVHGHSMGGLVVASYAAQYAGRSEPRLSGVVLSSAALKLPPAVSASSRHVVGMLATLAPGLAIQAVDETEIVREAGARSDLASDPVIIRDKLPARTVATILNGIVAIEGRMQDITAPLLILHGTADRVTEPDGSREMAKRAGSADKSLKIYDGAYHDLLHEPEGTAVIREIVAFVSTRSKPAT